MEWLFNRFGARTTKIWPFEAAGALRTTAVAKAPKGSGGLPKQKCLGSPIKPWHREITDDPREYYRGGWSPSPLSSVPVLRESRGGVASVGASPWGLSHPMEMVWKPGSQGRLGCPESGHG